MNLRTEPTRLLRRALMADGVISGLSGVLMVAAPAPIGALIGASPAVIALVGLLLVAYGVMLVRNARRDHPRREEAGLAVALNVAWVIGTAAVVAAGWLTREGNYAALFVADVVLVFAILEGIALRRTASPVARA